MRRSLLFSLSLSLTLSSLVGLIFSRSFAWPIYRNPISPASSFLNVSPRVHCAPLLTFQLAALLCARFSHSLYLSFSLALFPSALLSFALCLSLFLPLYIRRGVRERYSILNFFPSSLSRSWSEQASERLSLSLSPYNRWAAFRESTPGLSSLARAERH